MTEVAIVATTISIMAAIGLGMLAAVGWAQYELDRDHHRNTQEGQDHG
ncbi:MAG: hypothetical protein L0G59_09880 [Kocuria sp.]|nr:hypothetical protein [Kocuria sp.]